jgi:lipopolysaccharide transport system ATP-binding protein
MSNVVISVENVSKSYQLGVIGTGTFRGDFQRWWAKLRGLPDPHLKIGEKDYGNRDGETVWALKDINFQIYQGQAVGVIGRNGAGKSTLLKILSRVTAPTSGEIKVKGRVASLLEVGTGFHPELTGRENIFLNGAILGMSRDEIIRKFDEIVDFSGVEKYIDTPVKRYSSGMYVRLAFAVAAHLEPEILVVDEVLAVGDAEFQKKCLGKMSDVAHEGRTVLFVSHNMAAIESLCERAICINSGGIVADDSVDKVIQLYLAQSVVKSSSVDLTTHPGRSKSMKSVIKRISFADAEGNEASIFRLGDSITFKVLLDAGRNNYNYSSVSISIFNYAGTFICKFASWAQSPIQWSLNSCKTVSCVWEDCRLSPGSYYIGVGFGDGVQVIDYVERAAVFDIHEADIYGTGKIGTGLFVPDAEWIIE